MRQYLFASFGLRKTHRSYSPVMLAKCLQKGSQMAVGVYTEQTILVCVCVCVCVRV